MHESNRIYRIARKMMHRKVKKVVLSAFVENFMLEPVVVQKI